MHEQWKGRIIDNPKHLFAFFSKSNPIKEEQSGKIVENIEKSNDLLAEVEMSKEKLYINDNENKIYEENLHNYN